MPHRIVILGSGTAGAVAASYIKSYWGDAVEVTQIYDHNRPCIGVGESTTPHIFHFLQRVGLTFEDLVKGTSSTVKLGIRFKDWLGDGASYYHNFLQGEGRYDDMSSEFASEVAAGSDEGLTFQDWRVAEENMVPHSCYKDANFAAHLDSQEFSRFVERWMGDSIRVIDGVVEHVSVEGGEIKSLRLADGSIVTADFFLDASGLARTLIGRLDGGWADRSDYLPVDRAIPNPVPHSKSTYEPYTLAEATRHGWIWQVPLQHRYGTGYVYSSKFTSDDEARADFSGWLERNHGVGLTSDRLIEFGCGYYERPWSGNCLAVGLAAGFVEPLESTSIHITTMQLDHFCARYTLRNLKYDRDNYNRHFAAVWADTCDFIRFHYHTRRRDSPFWRHIADTTPEWLSDMAEKLSSDVVNKYHFRANLMVFSEINWCPVALGLGLCDRGAARRYLDLRGIAAHAERERSRKSVVRELDRAVARDHGEFISFLRGR